MDMDSHKHIHLGTHSCKGASGRGSIRCCACMHGRTCMHAAMQLSLEWLFQPGSWTSGCPRLTCTVKRRIPFSLGPGADSCTRRQHTWCARMPPASDTQFALDLQQRLQPQAPFVDAAASLAHAAQASDRAAVHMTCHVSAGQLAGWVGLGAGGAPCEGGVQRRRTPTSAVAGVQPTLYSGMMTIVGLPMVMLGFW
jgi:hypothetical protein